MIEVIIPAIVLVVLIFILELFFFKWKNILISLMIVVGVISFSAIAVLGDQNAQMTDVEVWSGRVIDWSHKEEWDQWHPPSTSCSTDSNGNRKCTTRPGYWQHHNAKNSIKTSDDGWISVSKLPNGEKMDDDYPNTVEELKQYWKEGTPTASTHSYVNKVQASYSVFKHENIDLEDFPDLPEYPNKVKDKMYIDRIVGDVPNKKEANLLLSEWNSELNKMIPDPEDKEKKKSWKQVNIIFVNVGENKSQEYGFALQDKWEGGNKNDFVVSFSMNKDGKVNWVYPFSWSEVEILKLEVKDYIMSFETIEDFVPVVNEVSTMVSEKFVRKEFADFSYLHIEVSGWVKIFIWILVLAAVIVRLFIGSKEIT